MQKKKSFKNTENQVFRVRLPRGDQTFGIVERRLGGARMYIRCLDKKKRICRIPGALRRSLWVREGNIVLVQPWDIQGDTKGDIIYKYSNSQIQWLKKKGYLEQLDEMEEF